MTNILDFLQKYLHNNDTYLGVGVIFILGLIIIPLPGSFLDALIAVSLMTAILILLTALSATSPAEFSVFPTLLLITTVYRLAVNISTTRMILSEGKDADSALITAFGSFVVGGDSSIGNLVVGIIIFTILTLVQVLVITKGATRVSEVAARFALDSLPGKQLAIDADFSQGHITETEARSRRENLDKEMRFYGAMDGASKFVQGDVRLGLVMVVINIIGGLIIGTAIHGENFADAAATYTRFTIGDGLVSTLPALLISTATGIIVTRSSSEFTLSNELKTQLVSKPRTLYVVGATLMLSGLIPGFPIIATSLSGGLLLYLGYRIDQAIKTSEEQKKDEKQHQAETKAPETFLQHLKTEVLEVEFGYNLIALVDPKANGTLLDQIARIRQRFAKESGLIVPPIRIRDNMAIEPNEYLIKIHGNTIGKSRLEPDKLMAINTGRVEDEIEDLPSFKEPTYNLTAYWISKEQKHDIESAGYDVVDCATVIATHLSNIIQENSSEIMGRLEVKNIIDSIKEDNPVIVDEVMVEKKVGLGTIQSVLQGLLRENVSIKNMTRILEAIANHADKSGNDTTALIEHVRQSLHRQIVADYTNENDILECITMDPGIDRKVREGIHYDPEQGQVISLDPRFQVALRDALTEEYSKAQKAQKTPVFVCSRAIRPGIFYILGHLFTSRSFAVLAHEEIASNIKTNVIGQVNIKKATEEEAKS